MSREMTVSYELLTAIADVQKHLAGIRPFIWERARLATAERTTIARASIERPIIGIIGGEIVHGEGYTWHSDDNGGNVVVEVSVMTRLRDGRSVSSVISMVTGPDRWRVHPFIQLEDDGTSILWEGASLERDDPASFRECLDAASKALVNQTIRLDFSTLTPVG